MLVPNVLVDQRVGYPLPIDHELVLIPPRCQSDSRFPMPGIISFHRRNVGRPRIEIAAERHLFGSEVKEDEGHFDTLGGCRCR